jgi:hypothetical protein
LPFYHVEHPDIEGVWKSGDLRLAAIAAKPVFSAGPGVSRIHDGESRRLIEAVRNGFR